MPVSWCSTSSRLGGGASYPPRPGAQCHHAAQHEPRRTHVPQVIRGRGGVWWGGGGGGARVVAGSPHPCARTSLKALTAAHPLALPPSPARPQLLAAQGRRLPPAPVPGHCAGRQGVAQGGRARRAHAGVAGAPRDRWDLPSGGCGCVVLVFGGGRLRESVHVRIAAAVHVPGAARAAPTHPCPPPPHTRTHTHTPPFPLAPQACA